MRLHLKDSQLTLVFFLSRSCKMLNHFLTKIMKSLSKEKLLPPGMIFLCLGLQKEYSQSFTLPVRNDYKRALFFQFHSPFSSTDDPLGHSKRAVSSHPAFLPVVIQERPFPGHCYNWQGTSFLLPSMQPIHLTWQYYPATHFYREDGSSMPTATMIPIYKINPLNDELNPICHLRALLGAHHILHVSRIR
jgi:hypothetical protein